MYIALQTSAVQHSNSHIPLLDQRNAHIPRNGHTHVIIVVMHTAHPIQVLGTETLVEEELQQRHHPKAHRIGVVTVQPTHDCRLGLRGITREEFG